MLDRKNMYFAGTPPNISSNVLGVTNFITSLPLPPSPPQKKNKFQDITYNTQLQFCMYIYGGTEILGSILENMCQCCSYITDIVMRLRSEIATWHRLEWNEAQTGSSTKISR